jgi:hypothetical protein
MARKTQKSLSTAELAKVIDAPKDTVRTWSTRKINGRPLIYPDMVGSVYDPLKEGEWRRFTATDAVACAIMVALVRSGLSAVISQPAAVLLTPGLMHIVLEMEDTALAERFGQSRASLFGDDPAEMENWYAKLWERPAIVAYWPVDDRLAGEVLLTYGEYRRQGAGNRSIPMPRSLPSGFVVLDIIHILNVFRARAVAAGLYDELANADYDRYMATKPD